MVAWHLPICGWAGPRQTSGAELALVSLSTRDNLQHCLLVVKFPSIASPDNLLIPACYLRRAAAAHFCLARTAPISLLSTASSYLCRQVKPDLLDLRVYFDLSLPPPSAETIVNERR
ncbi:hypothetical protein TMatcc_000243 [Talaromyces marneffei ATCC 18224]